MASSEGRRIGKLDAKSFIASGGGSALQIKISSPDLAKMRKQLERFPRTAAKIHSRAVLRGARALAEIARGNGRTPVITGRLRASIHHRKISPLSAATFVGVNYGRYVHEGTRFMKGQPFLLWALKGGGQKKITEIFKKAVDEVNKKIFKL